VAILEFLGAGKRFAVAAPVKAEIDVSDVGARLLEETGAKALLRDSGCQVPLRPGAAPYVDRFSVGG
jgi:hypothetical protein